MIPKSIVQEAMENYIKVENKKTPYKPMSQYGSLYIIDYLGCKLPDNTSYGKDAMIKVYCENAE